MREREFPTTKAKASKAGTGPVSSQENYNAPFPTRLRKARNDTGLSQQAVAKRLGLSKSAIGYWETGDSLPDAKSLALMAELYGVSCDYLVGSTKYHGKDRDARSLCDGLGLTAGAAAKLSELTHYEQRRRALSVLLEDESFTEILDTLVDCMDFRYWASFLEGQICNPEKMPNPDDGTKEVQEILAEKDRDAWRISRIFKPQLLMARIAERLIEESESCAEMP